MLEANDMVEAKMAEIRERKMYEMKRMFAAKMDEALGGLSIKEIEARKKAGYVKASAPKEKGGLGLSSYDLGQEEKKKRLAGRLKKKVAEETIDEMRAPGEVPGSAERKQDAEKLRTMRKGLGMLDVGRRTLNKDYLAARKAQMTKKPATATKAPAATTAAAPASISQAPTITPPTRLVGPTSSSAKPSQTQQPASQPPAQNAPKDPWDHWTQKYNKRKQFQKSGKFKGWKARQALHNVKNKIKHDILSGAGIKRAFDSPIMHDLHSIGTRNL